MACGEYGPGRMSEPAAILAAITAALDGETHIPLRAASRADQWLAGRRVVVTSGPTHEPIDPVRYLGNRSSGKQGHAIAAAAAKAGAEVVLVSGPVALADPPGVVTRHVETAAEMRAAVEAALPADLFIATAAVADWRVKTASAQKIKKSAAPPQFTLAENPDILAAVARRKKDRPRLVVGFAAETEHLVDHAREKLQHKHCDIIVANDVGGAHGAMGKDENQITLITASGAEPWPKMRKEDVAAKLVVYLSRLLEERRDG
jgi:phosphopantothenoylcysteine decarboxylase/phosphopantothenate--cysteine ligase